MYINPISGVVAGIEIKSPDGQRSYRAGSSVGLVSDPGRLDDGWRGFNTCGRYCLLSRSINLSEDYFRDWLEIRKIRHKKNGTFLRYPKSKGHYHYHISQALDLLVLVDLSGLIVS